MIVAGREGLVMGQTVLEQEDVLEWASVLR